MLNTTNLCRQDAERPTEDFIYLLLYMEDFSCHTDVHTQTHTCTESSPSDKQLIFSFGKQMDAQRLKRRRRGRSNEGWEEEGKAKIASYKVEEVHVKRTRENKEKRCELDRGGGRVQKKKRAEVIDQPHWFVPH